MIGHSSIATRRLLKPGFRQRGLLFQRVVFCQHWSEEPAISIGRGVIYPLRSISDDGLGKGALPTRVPKEQPCSGLLCDVSYQLAQRVPHLCWSRRDYPGAHRTCSASIRRTGVCRNFSSTAATAIPEQLPLVYCRRPQQRIMLMFIELWGSNCRRIK
jgi:hypothetical protein